MGLEKPNSGLDRGETFFPNSGSDLDIDETFQISRNVGLDIDEIVCLLDSQLWVNGWVEDTSFRVSCQDDGPDPTSGKWMGGGHFFQGLLSG